MSQYAGGAQSHCTLGREHTAIGGTSNESTRPARPHLPKLPPIFLVSALAGIGGLYLLLYNNAIRQAEQEGANDCLPRHARSVNTPRRISCRNRAVMRPLIPREALQSASTIPTPAPMPSVPLEDFNKLMQLIGQQLLRLRRQDAGERANLLLNLGCIEDQPIEGNQRRQTGEQGEQDRICDAACDQKQVLLRYLAPCPP